LEDRRAKAVDLFTDIPDVEEVITEPSSNPFSLWLELYFVLVDCYQRNPPNDDLIGRIYDFGV
jgi:hypothetical protein